MSAGGVAMRTPSADIGPRRLTHGFTLIEMMITVAVVAILAAVALPNYTDYVTRSKIVEATSGLSDMRVRLEQYFLDSRQYPTTCVAPAAGPAPAGQIYLPASSKYFTVTCALTATTYTVTATGQVAARAWLVSSTRSIRPTTARRRACPAAGPAPARAVPAGSPRRAGIADMATPTSSRGFTMLELMVALVDRRAAADHSECRRSRRSFATARSARRPSRSATACARRAPRQRV